MEHGPFGGVRGLDVVGCHLRRRCLGRRIETKVAGTRCEVSSGGHVVIERVVSRLGAFVDLYTGKDWGLVHCASVLVAWAATQLESLFWNRGRFEVEGVHGSGGTSRCLWLVVVVVTELEVAWKRDRHAGLVRSHGV